MSEQKEFESGETVRLKSGGPVMTVQEMRGDGSVACIWFEASGTETRGAVFKPEMLTLAP